MATTRRETRKRLSRNKIYKIISYILLAGLVLLGFALGRITKPVKVVTEVETKEVIKTVEVPVYQETENEDSVPGEIEMEYYDVPLSHNLQRFIYEICLDENIPISLAMALIDTESRFQQETVSSTNDYGLMQINAVNFDWIEEKYRTGDMLNPYQNVYVGLKILGGYIEKYNEDYTKALMCYNLGEYGAKKLWQQGVNSSRYSEKVLSKWEEYK